VIRSAGVEAPGVVPVEGDAITALHDRILEQLSCQARVVVVQPVQQGGIFETCGWVGKGVPSRVIV
jgi:hypothetical protein